MRKPKKGKPEKGKNLVRVVNADPGAHAKQIANAQKADPSGATVHEIIALGPGCIVNLPVHDLPDVLRVKVRGAGVKLTADDAAIVSQMKASGLWTANDICAYTEECARSAKRVGKKAGRKNTKDELARFCVRHSAGESIDSLARERGCAPDSLLREFSRLKDKLKKTD